MFQIHKFFRKYFFLSLVYHMADGDGGGGAGGGDGGGDGGGTGDHWSANAGLPEDVATWDEVKNADSADAFYKQMGDMRSRMGRSVVIPGEDAGAEDWSKFFDKLPGDKVLPAPTDDASTAALYAKLGVPAEAAKYASPEGSGIEGEQLIAFQAEAFAANLTQKQFEKYVTGKVAAATTATENASVAFKEGLETLAAEWGATFKDRSATAEKVREKFFSFIPQAAMNAETTKAMFTLSQQFGGEGQEILGQAGGAGGGMTPDEAATKIGEIWNNKEHAYHNTADIGHAAAKKKMRELYKLRDGGGEVSVGDGGGKSAGIGGVAKFA